MKLLTVAACALVDTDGRVLLAQRPTGKPMAGLWEFPGGKVEDGERPEQTLIRELKEELGILVNEACRAAHIRQPQLSRFSSADAALCVPPVGRNADGAGRPAVGMGPHEPLARLPDAASGRAAGVAFDDAAVNVNNR